MEYCAGMQPYEPYPPRPAGRDRARAAGARLPRSSSRARRLGGLASGLAAVLGLVAAWGPRAQAATPQEPALIPGLEHTPPLSEVARGRLLLEELRCTACHAGELPGALPRVAAPRLEEIGWRASPTYLARFLGDPAGTLPGARMPDVLAGVPSARRAEVALSLTHYLVSLNSRPASTPSEGSEASASDEPGDAALGQSLFHDIGCVACHAARSSPSGSQPAGPAGVRTVALGQVPVKYSRESLADFLYQPLRVRPSGRMPDMGLSRAEARALASYLIGPEPPARERLVLEPQRVAEGARFFAELACAACHIGPGVAPPARSGPAFAARLAELDPRRGCLAPTHTAGPRYSLDESQLSALRAALASPETPLHPSEEVGFALATFNCIACHKRNAYGGVSRALDPYFRGDEPNLGDHGRLPPELTGAGAKLRPEWMRQVLFDGATVRRYMHTRMPQFGAEALGDLPARFARADALEPFEVPDYEGEQAREMREAGRRLLGSAGLGCIVCHDFNGHAGSGMRGLDLVDSCERLQPAWFAAFLTNPQRFRPGILMPESWPDGRAVQTTILAGDSEAQLRAIWYFLTDGRTANTPEGLAPRPSRLSVGERARTYRGRSRVAGFRGIAVGFPDGIHYAYDANNGALAALWQGDFLSVRWDGQGAGDFDPAAPVIELARDLCLAQLDSRESPWPLRPRMDDQHPVNPDPTYPRQYGYRFRGYDLDQADVPTLRYAIGAVEIEDRSVGEREQGRALLRRRLHCESPAAETLWFRALVGDFGASPGATSGRDFELGRLRLRIPDVPIHVRLLPGSANERELLLELALPEGPSEWSFEYEILR